MNDVSRFNAPVRWDVLAHFCVEKIIKKQFEHNQKQQKGACENA